MAKPRRDTKGRTLRKGESFRKSDKSYVYRYTDPLGAVRQIYSKDLVVLRERVEKLKKDQQDGLDVYVAGKSDINTVWERYIASKTELRGTTRSNYNYMYDHFIRDSFGKNKIAEVKYSDVLFFYNYLLNDVELQINTLETIHTVLHPTFEMAVRDGIIRTNPSNRIMGDLKKKFGKNKGVRHALTIEHQRAFMEYVANSPVYYKWTPLFTVMFGTGGRIGEIIGLRWDDLDYENRLINVNHSITYYPREEEEGKPKCRHEVSLTKTEAGIRDIPMLEKVYDAFQEEYDRQKKTGFNQTEIDGMTGFIFQNRNGNVHNPQGVNRAIRRIYEAHNVEEVVKAIKKNREPVLIPHFSCHITRHTFCARLCEQEDNLKVIMDIMGHADIETTAEIYAEVTNKRKKESFDKLSRNIDVF